MTRQSLFALGSIYLVLGAVLVVTWVASSALLVLILAVLLIAAGLVALGAGFRRPTAQIAPTPVVRPASGPEATTGGDGPDFDGYQVAVHPDVRARQTEPVAAAPVPPPAATVAQSPAPSTGRCASCGRQVLTTRQFVAKAAEFGYHVDPLTGDASTGPGQALFDQLEAARGYTCRACGRSHCTECLMRTPPHPMTHGPRCPSCAEGPHAPLED